MCFSEGELEVLVSEVAENKDFFFFCILKKGLKRFAKVCKCSVGNT